MPMRQLKLSCSGRTLQQKGAVAIAVPWPRNLCNDESECQSHLKLKAVRYLKKLSPKAVKDEMGKTVGTVHACVCS